MYNQLLDSLEKRKIYLGTFSELKLLFQEMESLQNEMIEKLRTRFSNLGIFKTNNTATTTATAAASPTSNLIK